MVYDGFWWFLYIFNHFYSCFEHPRYHWPTNSCWHMEFLEVNTGEPAKPLQLSSSFRWMWHELWVSVTSPSFLRVSILDVAMLFIHFSLDADQNSKLVKSAKLVNMQIFFSRYVFQMSAFSKVFTCFFSQHGRLLCDIVLANHRCGRLSEPQHRTHRAIFFHRGLRVNKYVYDICIKFVYFFL